MKYTKRANRSLDKWHGVNMIRLTFVGFINTYNYERLKTIINNMEINAIESIFKQYLLCVRELGGFIR